MSHRGVHVDASQYPLMRVVYNGVGDDKNFNDYLATLDATLKRAIADRARVAWIFDARLAGFAPPTQRRAQADWMVNNHEGARATCAGFAFVIDSAMIRGALTAVLWFAPMPAPLVVLSTVTAAEIWCKERLQEWAKKT